MACPSCQQPVEDAALFCGNCGFRVRQEATPAPATEATAPVVAVRVPAPSATDAPTSPTSAQNLAPASASPQSAAPTQPDQPQPIPGYAVPQAKPAESHTLELVLGILSIPASLFPLLGLGLGIPALVLARKHKATAPSVLSILGIVLSVLIIIFNIFYYVQHPDELKGQSSSTTVLTIPLRSQL